MTLVTLKALRESSKRKLYFVPFLATFLNACCGFLSVVKALDGYTTVAAYCIFGAACMDFLDGKLARAFGSCSYLGMELDSLCDAISFCFAPTILLYTWSVWTDGWLGLLVLAGYLCLGLFRLARFNLTSAQQQTAFIGLPTTIAAFFIAQLVLSYDWLANSPLRCVVTDSGLLITVALIAFLMASTIRFPSFKQARLVRRKQRILFVAGAFAVGAIAVTCGYPLIFLGLLGYISCCVALSIMRSIHHFFAK